MIWLTMDGKAYTHNKRGILFVSNSLVLSCCSIFAEIEGAKVAKKRMPNPNKSVFLQLVSPAETSDNL